VINSNWQILGPFSFRAQNIILKLIKMVGMQPAKHTRNSFFYFNCVFRFPAKNVTSALLRVHFFGAFGKKEGDLHFETNFEFYSNMQKKSVL